MASPDAPKLERNVRMQVPSVKHQVYGDNWSKLFGQRPKSLHQRTVEVYGHLSGLPGLASLHRCILYCGIGPFPFGAWWFERFIAVTRRDVIQSHLKSKENEFKDPDYARQTLHAILSEK